MRAILISLLVFGVCGCVCGCGGDDAGTPEQPVDDATSVEQPLPVVVKIVYIVGVVGIVVWGLSGTATPKKPVAKLVGEPIANSIGMVLVPIPAGEFMMGSPESEECRDDDETQHGVTLTKSFHLGRTEVTQGQWKAVMGTPPWEGEDDVKEGDDYPATHVSWEDAVEFCRKLSEKEGVEYRLPTEAEWEYACRAGTTTVWSFGDVEPQLGGYAWCRDNAGDFGEKYAHIVGQKKTNPWGLHDMHGNVWEWCHDRYGKYPSGDVTDPVGPASGSYRVFRGGGWRGLHDMHGNLWEWSDDQIDSWFNRGGDCRSADRGGDTPSFRDGYLGFRVLRSSAK